MNEAYIIDGIRTPIGKLAGALSPVRADDLAAHAMKTLLARNPTVEPRFVDDVYLGCANQAGEDNRNVARMSLLLAGIPFAVPGVTVNRLCASGMSAIVSAARCVQTGDGDLYIAGGVEQMTRAPYVLSKPGSAFGRDAELFDTSLGWRFVNSRMRELYGTDAMGETAENVAEKHGISREDQDRFAAASQQKAALARAGGVLAEEIVPVEIPRRKADPVLFEADEFIRPDTTLEALARLKPAFRPKGTVTAGNSSGLNDGACVLLVASERAVRKLSLTPLARVVSSAVVGVEPRLMGMGPVEATRKALRKADMSLDEIDVLELNEAFASQSLACLREMGLADDDPRVNPNGGAIALGHPLGMSGARLALTSIRELLRREATYALCTMCIGVGQGKAAIFERT